MSIQGVYNIEARGWRDSTARKALALCEVDPGSIRSMISGLLNTTESDPLSKEPGVSSNSNVCGS